MPLLCGRYIRESCMKNYGYKVCYKEHGKRRFVRYLATNTKDGAIFMMNEYIQNPQYSRKTNLPLVKPIWKVIPIKSKKEFIGIWKDAPF